MGDLLELIEKALAGPSFPVAERARLSRAGYVIHEPDKLPSLMPLDDWFEDSFVATKGTEAVVSLVRARQPGTGAWHRLVYRLRQNGFIIKVIEPIGLMERILTRQGFDGPFTEYDDEGDRMKVWRLLATPERNEIERG